jgi:hypothetical protein
VLPDHGPGLIGLCRFLQNLDNLFFREAFALHRGILRLSPGQCPNLPSGSGFGAQVNYTGWIFANAADKKWTSVRFRRKYTFQSPIHQNFRHVLAVQNQLEFIPREAIESVVVFCGSAEFKTEVPAGVVHVDQLVAHLKQRTEERIPLNKLQYAVGRIETARLALSGQTDIEHVESLRRRFGREAE